MASILEQLDKIDAAAETAKAAALAEYREIVRRSDSSQRGDAIRLHAVMKELGISKADFQADIIAIERVNALLDEAVPQADIDKELAEYQAEIDKADQDRRNSLAECARHVFDPQAVRSYINDWLNVAGKQRDELAQFDLAHRTFMEAEISMKRRREQWYAARDQLEAKRRANPRLFAK